MPAAEASSTATAGIAAVQSIAPQIVALGGLMVAALSLFLSWRERTANYRQTLHAAQIDVCNELIDYMYELHWAAANFLNSHSLPLDEGARQEAAGLAEGEDLSRHVFKHSAILPSVVYEAAMDYGIAVADAFRDEKSTSWDEAINPATARLRTVVELVRSHLGTERLSDETLRRVSRGPRPFASRP